MLVNIYALPPAEKTVVPPPGGYRSGYWYQVRVSFRPNNPVHRALLYAGLGAEGDRLGGYAYLTSSGYDANQDLSQHVAVHYMAVEKILGPLEDLPEPAPVPLISRVQEYPECGSTHLSWDSRNKAPAGVPEGRLRTNEVDCEFFLGCDDCSETVDTIPVTVVIRELNHARSAD